MKKKIPLSRLIPNNRSVGPFVVAATACFVALLGMPISHAQLLPECDRSPDALTEAFAKLNITDEPQVVDHTFASKARDIPANGAFTPMFRNVLPSIRRSCKHCCTPPLFERTTCM